MTRTERFPNELHILRYFEQIRWGRKPVCPYCGSKKLSKRLKDLRFKCYNCNRTISVTVGTYLHGTNVKLESWLLAFSIINDAENGVSVMHLKKELRLHYYTAWKVFCKIQALVNITDNSTDVISPEKKNELERDIKIVSKVIKKVTYRGIMKLIRKTRYRFKLEVLQISKEEESHKFSNILKLIAETIYSMRFDCSHVDFALERSFWDIIEKRIRAQHQSINLEHIGKYIFEAIFEIHLKRDIDWFDILTRNSMRQITWTITKRIQRIKRKK